MFLFLLLYPPFLSQDLTRNMKISRSLLPALLLVASVVVMSVPGVFKGTCDHVHNGVCYQFCPQGGCSMECIDLENMCSQDCSGKFPNAFLKRITRNLVISAGKHVTGA